MSKKKRVANANDEIEAKRIKVEDELIVIKEERRERVVVNVNDVLKKFSRPKPKLEVRVEAEPATPVTSPVKPKEDSSLIKIKERLDPKKEVKNGSMKSEEKKNGEHKDEMRRFEEKKNGHKEHKEEKKEKKHKHLELTISSPKPLVKSPKHSPSKLEKMKKHGSKDSAKEVKDHGSKTKKSEKAENGIKSPSKHDNSKSPSKSEFKSPLKPDVSKKNEKPESNGIHSPKKEHDHSLLHHDEQKPNTSTASEEPKDKKKKKYKLPKISERFRKYVHIDIHPNGGASILRADWRKIKQHFDKTERFQFAQEVIALGLAEINETPVFVICILDNAAEYLSDLLEHLANKHSQIPVKVGSLVNKQEVQTMPMGDYYKHVLDTCKHGTFRYGPLNAMSLVGTKQEECGDYFKVRFDYEKVKTFS